MATPEIAAMAARAEAAEARFNARAATREAAVAQRLGRPAAPKTMAQPEGPAQDGAWGDTSSDTVMADLCREACKNLYADQEVEKEAKNAAEPAGCWAELASMEPCRQLRANIPTRTHLFCPFRDFAHPRNRRTHR